MRPQTQFIDRTTGPSRGAGGGGTGTGFMAIVTDRGPTIATAVKSLAEAVTKFGARLSTSIGYDALDVFFKEGGTRAVIGRILGSGAAKATNTLVDGAAAIALTATAKNPGTWGNNLTIDVNLTAQDATIPGGSFVLVVKESGTVVETSTILADVAAAVAWATSKSTYIDLALGASSNDPAHVAGRALAGGSDGAAVTDTERIAALDLFTRDFGPGQVAIPGATTTAAATAVLAHAKTFNRIPVVDGPDSSSDTTVRAAAAALRSLAGEAIACLLAPWDVAPGLAAGTTRTVPPCARVMGVMSRNDAAGLSPNESAAGENGEARYVTDVTQTYTDAALDRLNDAGVNVSIKKQPENAVQLYGYRTLVDPVADELHLPLNNARLEMAIKTDCQPFLDAIEFKQIDGRGRLFSRLNTNITGVLMRYWNADSLFGETPAEAFNVDTGPTVNTDETIAAREVHVEVGAKMSPFAEQTIFGLTRVATDEVVA